MMKKEFALFFAFAMAYTAFSQNVELRFTGVKADGTHIRLDSVWITNNGVGARNWTQTVVYPDSVLTFGPSAIAVADGFSSEISCYPNPSLGRATVVVPSSESGNATLQLFDLSGRKIFELGHSLSQGDNIFDVTLPRNSVYLLSVVTRGGVRTVKLLNNGNGGNAVIAPKSVSSVTERRQSTRHFTPGDSLRFVGFATHNGKVLISRTIRQRQNNSETFQLVFVPPIQGMLNGLFSVSRTEQVRFSQGNLQWRSSGTHAVVGNATENGTWRFATNQFDTIGVANRNASSSYTGWIDFFGWGTSGYGSSEPYQRTEFDYYADSVLDLNGTNYDWGKFNAISNGGNQPGLWRVIKKAEMEYLFSGRPDAAQKWGMGSVGGVIGLVLLPDIWNLPAGLTFNEGFHNPGTALYNAYSTSQWSQMEDAGAVFLPCGGIRSVQSGQCYVNSFGVYWMADRYSVYSSPGHIFFASAVSPTFTSAPFGTSVNKHDGLCVRLVKTY